MPYEVIVIGRDDPAGWLCAGALAGAGLKVALVLESEPDPGAPPFPWLPIDPGRVDMMARAAGLSPCPAPPNAYAADFQVIIEGRPVDFIADPAHQARALERDLPGHGPAFQALSQELKKEAGAVLEAAEESGFPGDKGRRGKGLLAGLFKKKPGIKVRKEPFSSLSGNAPASVKSVMLAACSACMGAALDDSSPSAQVALSWHYLTGLHRGAGRDMDIREQAAEKIAQRGEVLAGKPLALIKNGRSVESVRLEGGSKLDAVAVIGARDLVGPLAGERAPEGGKTTRTTWFFTLDGRGAPDSLAPRAVIVGDPEARLAGDNLIILARHPRVPRRETLCVTMIDPPSGLDQAEIPGILASRLKWLDPKTIAPDDTRESRSHSYPAPPVDMAPWRPDPAAESANLFYLASDYHPSWGPAGMVAALQGQVEACSRLVEKQKG